LSTINRGVSLRRMSPASADAAFFSALLAADVVALEALLSDDFVLVDVMAGGVVHRPALLDVLASREMSFTSIEPAAPAAIRHYGNGNVAVAIGETRMSGTFAQQRWSAHSRYTHVFVKDAEGTWRLASAQGTPIEGRRQAR
jgi:ketosteroid isomerase-like protein